MNPHVIDFLLFDYCIELWRSPLPVTLFKKKFHLIIFRPQQRCLLKVGTTYVAEGHLKDDSFIVDKVLTKDERSFVEQCKNRYEINSRGANL
jgi:hypothetical protein